MVNEIVNDRFQVVPVGAVRGPFIETVGGFLRLDEVVEFRVWEHSSDDWHVDAYDGEGHGYSVGLFKSEAEARETVISMIEE